MKNVLFMLISNGLLFLHDFINEYSINTSILILILLNTIYYNINF